MDYRSKYKPKNIKLWKKSLRRKHEEPYDIVLGEDFLDMTLLQK